MVLSQYQQRLIEIVQKHPDSIDEISLDSIDSGFAEGIRKDPKQLSLTYCRSFGARGFMALAKHAFFKFQDTRLYFSVQRINRYYNPENDKIKKRLIGMYHASSPSFKEMIGDFNDYLIGACKEEWNKFKPYSHVDLRLWAGEPKDIRSEGSHCDWSCNGNGLIQAPEVKNEDLEKLFHSRLTLQAIKSHSGTHYKELRKFPRDTRIYYNEEMRLSRVLDIR
jgi:hypothetical protein